jgi:hypothetical protein
MKDFSKLCTPAKIYFAIAAIATLFDLFNGVAIMFAFWKLVFAFIWTFILGRLCDKGYKSISWFLVLLPYILMFLGSLNIYHVTEDQRQFMRSIQFQGAFGQEAFTDGVITDISMKNVTRNCDTDCSYKFNYLQETPFISREGGTINSVYLVDKTKQSPAIFNGQKFAPFMSQIIAPSPVMINGSYPPGEIRIQHLLINDNGEISRDAALFVIIPFKISDESSPASRVITDIINKVNEPMTSQGPIGMLTMTYNLQNIVPVKSFFYLKKTDNTRSTNIIIYGDSGAIPLSSSTMEQLKKVTRPPTQERIQMEFALPPTNELFFNPNGENTLPSQSAAQQALMIQEQARLDQQRMLDLSRLSQLETSDLPRAKKQYEDSFKQNRTGLYRKGLKMKMDSIKKEIRDIKRKYNM